MNNKKKILTVEDDRMISDVYRIALENAGFEVGIAMDGEEGISKIASFLPDLILMDIFMPKKTGFEVLDIIREDPIFGKIPVIILTNIYVDQADMVRKGVKHCLIKAEITPGSLVEKVNEILGASIS